MAGSTDEIRVITALDVSPLRSQALYHAVAEAMEGDGPDTILLVRPTRAYVCIGFHQDAQRELDLDACASLQLPIIRREVGGGAVLLDQHQVFLQWVFRAGRLPASPLDRYRLFIGPLTSTYGSLGVDGVYRPVNDVHVAGRKIGGAGAARIGQSEVLVGSIMFDFDALTMSKVLRVPSEKMRDKVASTMSEYVTSLHRELGREIGQDEVVSQYLGNASGSLQRPLAPGTLSRRELMALERIEKRLGSASWTYRRTSRLGAGVKVSEDVTVLEGTHKAPAGLVQLLAVVRSGVIIEAQVFGDFTLIPQSALPAIESSLQGVTANPTSVSDAIAALYAEVGLDSPGLEPGDFGAAMAAALGETTR